MKQLSIAALFTLTSFCFAFAGDQSKFVGAWDLVGYEFSDGNGGWRPMKLENNSLKGSLAYSQSGIMHAQIYCTNRNYDITSEEAAFLDDFMDNCYMAYYGAYSLNETDMIVTHERFTHNIEDKAVNAPRRYQFDGEYLYLSPMTLSNTRLKWVKVK